MRSLVPVRVRLGVCFAALALSAMLTLLAAGTAQAQSPRAERQAAAIQQILSDNAGNAEGIKAEIKKIMGIVQGDRAVDRAQQILDALPSEISDAEWAAVKEALSERAAVLDSANASAAIGAKLAAKEIALGKTQMHAALITDQPDEDESRSKPKVQMDPPPQEEVVCASQNCP